MGYLGATLTQVFTLEGGAGVSLRDVTIGQMGNGARECGWRHALEARGGFGGFWKSQLELRTRHRTRRVDFRLLAEARRICTLRAPHEMGGGRWKSQNRKNVCLSPYVETFNSKIIKGFVPELRSRYVFFVFRIPMFYVYMLWTFYVRFTHIRIWLCNILRCWDMELMSERWNVKRLDRVVVINSPPSSYKCVAERTSYFCLAQ